MTHKKLPTQERLLELFTYDEQTGVLIRRRTGKVAGTKAKNGYLTTYVDTSEFKVHRLIWMIVTGCDPADLTIDHKNRDRSDNRFDNLRLATFTEQNINKIVANVYRQKGRTTFRVKFTRLGKQVLDKSFKTLEEAVKAIASFKEEETACSFNHC